MDNSQFQKFSESARQVLLSAQYLSVNAGSATDTGYILLSILLHKDSIAHNILVNNDITAEKVELYLNLARDTVTHATTDRQPEITSDTGLTLERAVNIAAQYDHVGVDTEHLLLALLSNHEFQSYKLLQRLGASPERVKEQLLNLFKELLQFDEGEKLSENTDEMLEEAPVPKRGKKSSAALDYFSTDLTASAEQHKLDPVIGRNEEIARVIQILSRRTKNNPVLIGEPGVGKTAIVEGIAQRIVSGDVPPNLIGKRLLSLDLALLVAGTMYRGQFEERIKKIIDDLLKLDNAILFIDELHTIIGAGSAEGSLDAAQILKPSLAKGQIRVIGATTSDEFQKHIEKDAALTRRFQPVKVEEPSPEDTFAILQGVKPQYEKYHQIKISDEAIAAAVKLSNRYISDRFLPDKAIDVIDEASALVKTRDKRHNKMIMLTKQAEELAAHKETAIINESYDLASRLLKKEEAVKATLAKYQVLTPSTRAVTVTKGDVELVVARLSGIPVNTLASEDILHIKSIEKILSEHVVGQTEAISAIGKVIRRSRTGISQTTRPIASFIFLGPSGVGKSELAKMIAKHIYGKESALIKVDMSEFMEKHNVSRLVGAPAGYIGYEEGGKLTESIRRQPYSVLLLDEIEKAHPDVFNLLLQILEDGYLTDAKGRRIDFRQTMIIMTSNIGMEELTRQANIGFAAAGTDAEKEALAAYESLKNDLLKSLKDQFKPEFLNRLDQIIVFKPLTKDNIRQIVDIQIEELVKRAEEKGFKLVVDAAARRLLMEKGFDAKDGARPVRRLVQNLIEDQLADAILEGKMDRRKTVSIRRSDEELVLV